MAHLESRLVHLARHAAVFDQVPGQLRETIQNALAAGFKEALERCRVGQGVGRRHRLGQQANDELTTLSVLFAEVAGADPVVHFLAPGQISLHVAPVKRVALPGLLVETFVSRRRCELRAVEQDIFQLNAECRHMLGCMHRLLQHLSQNHAGGAEQIAPARTERRVQVQRVHRSLLGEVFIFLVHFDTR
ncbi:hypothetical protein D3C84_667360 [compost metagenome]